MIRSASNCHLYQACFSAKCCTIAQHGLISFKFKGYPHNIRYRLLSLMEHHIRQPARSLLSKAARSCNQIDIKCPIHKFFNKPRLINIIAIAFPHLCKIINAIRQIHFFHSIRTPFPGLSRLTVHTAHTAFYLLLLV